MIISIHISFTKSFSNGGGINDGNDWDDDERQAKSEKFVLLHPQLQKLAGRVWRESECADDNCGDGGLLLWCWSSKTC